MRPLHCTMAAWLGTPGVPATLQLSAVHAKQPFLAADVTSHPVGRGHNTKSAESCLLYLEGSPWKSAMRTSRCGLQLLNSCNWLSSYKRPSAGPNTHHSGSLLSFSFETVPLTQNRYMSTRPAFAAKGSKSEVGSALPVASRHMLPISPRTAMLPRVSRRCSDCSVASRTLRVFAEQC